MICFPCKRLIAYILLFGQLLTSCGNPRYLRMGRIGPCVTSSSGSTSSSPLCRVSHSSPIPMALPQGSVLHFHQKGSSCWAVLESASTQPVHLPVRFGDGFTTTSLASSDPSWQQQYIHLHPDSAGSLEPSFVYIGQAEAAVETRLAETTSAASLSSSSTPCSASSACSYTFIKDPGYTIVLAPYGNRWQALVQDNRFPGLSRSYSADVTFEKGYHLESLISKDPSFQSSHIHLFSMDKGRSIVYIGSPGLKGGGFLNWFGYKSCTMLGCFNKVWRCVCGYKCSDNSCWQHCTKHYQSHRCVGCDTVARCPKYYTCQTCHSTTRCSSCCGCYERQRQEQIRLRERARRAAAQRAEEVQRQQQLRDQWARAQEQERLRQQQERERQERLRQQQERERQERLRQQQERERQERLRQQQERERQSVLSNLDARLGSSPIVQSTSSHVDGSIVKVGISDQTDQEEAYTFVYQGLNVEDGHGSSSYPASIDSESDTPLLPRCISSDSILSLYSKSSSRNASIDSSSGLVEENLPNVPRRCSSISSIFSLDSAASNRHDSTDSSSELLDVTRSDREVATRCSSISSISSLDSAGSNRHDSTDSPSELLDDLPSKQAMACTISKWMDDDPLPLLTRHSSNGSLFSLASIASTTSDCNASDKAIPASSTDQDTNDQSTILTPSTRFDAPIGSVSSPDPSLIPSFLSNYSTHLSSEEQDYFYRSVGKFVEEKLPHVELTTQQEIIDYFTHEGLLYPYVVAHYPPSEWIVQSLLKEVVAYPDEDTSSLNSFRRQWLSITEEYSIPDQVALLKSLRIKKLVHNISLLEISKILDFVLHTGSSGYAIVCSESVDWLSDLKRTWLSPKLALLTHLSESERDQLGCGLSAMDWGINMLDAFIKSIQDEVSLDPIIELLSVIQAYQVPDSLVHPIITTAPIHPGKSKAKQWTHTITYHSLLDSIHRLSPQLARSIETPLYNLLVSSCSAQFLEKVIRDHLDLINSHTDEFSKVLALLYDYQVTEEICASAFSLLPKVAGSDWVDKIDQAVATNLFQSTPQVYTTDELIERIAGASSAFTPEELKGSYDAVTQSYHSPSIVLQSLNDPDINKFKNKPISDWDKNQLYLWAKAVRSSHPSISQSELIAGVQHAVQLHHPFSPRDTQLLSLLTLLNPIEGMGRLAQINTGEGKSLIVAMLAAIHGLQGKKVDVITTSTELSIPEVKRQTPFFNSLSLTVAENSHMDTKPSAYKSDVVYGISGDFQADILRTSFLGKDVRGDRGFGVAIVDEVDSMLFDNRSHSVRLSEQTPGMTHLELPLGAIWEHVHRIVGQMTTIDDQLIFIPETWKRVGKTIKLASGAPWESCSETVSNKESFVTNKVQDHLEKLLRDLDDEEKSEYETFKSLDSQITYLEQSISNTTNAQEKEAKISSCKALSEKLKTLPWRQRYPVLDVPVHLRDLARFQIPYWVKSALNAAYGYKEDVHYTVRDGQIVPVHYNETGVLQPNMVWSDGLTQFLQLKEGLSIDPEGISTNFISNISFFKNYGASIYGLTGTLGEQSTKDFLHKMYHTDTVIIPPYQRRNIVDNAASPYLCKELRPIVLSNRSEWFQTIIDRALSHASHQRGALIICQQIREVKYLYKQLCKRYDSEKILTYTGEDATLEERKKIDSGEIIIATNIAGRGTDLETSQSVESHGGMYVAITFLPESYRVEVQNIGRTARSGKKGMGQLIIYDPVRSDIEDIKKYRDEQEVVASGKAIQDAQRMLVQDRLFSDFCKLERQYLPSVKECELVKQWKDLTIAWREHAAEALSPARVAEHVDKKVLNRKTELLAISDEEASKITAADQQNYRDKAVRKAESERPTYKAEYENNVLNDFCNAQSHLPEELVTCLRAHRVFDPNVSALSKEYSWGLYDRKGFEESWGIWLKKSHFEEQDLPLDKALDQFEDGFATPSKERAQKDQLVRNPYFYVLKGNEYLTRSDLEPAISYYDRAIGMDPAFSVNALYNKAHALLLYEKNLGDRQDRAYEALKQAKEIIGTISRPALLTFSTFIAQHDVKLLTSAHVQHQLNLLSQQENYIDKACMVIEEARDKQHHVKLTAQLVSETLNKSDEDHSKAIREAAVNGFTHLFTIERIEPVPWYSIVGLALISLTQITAGCLITACTAGTLGTGLIGEGVSDMITTVKSAIQGSFDWAAWAIQKAINLAVSAVSFGIQAFKGGVQSAKGAFKKLFGTVGIVSPQDGIKAAARSVGVALGEGVFSELTTSAAQWCANKVFIEDVEEEIRKQTEEKITEALLKNPLVVKALELDVKNGNNCWQNCFIQEGLLLLKEDQELQKKGKSVCAYMAREIALGVSENTMLRSVAEKKYASKHRGTIAKAAVKAAFIGVRATKAVDSVLNYTNEFMDKFNEKVQSHVSDIESASKQTALSTSSTAGSSTTTHKVLSSNAPPIDLEESDIVVDTAEEGTTYSSQKDPKANAVQKFYRATGPSHAKTIVEAFKDQITHTISNSVRQNALNPAINWGVSELRSAVFSKIHNRTNLLKKEAIGRQKDKTKTAFTQANNALSVAQKSAQAQQNQGTLTTDGEKQKGAKPTKINKHAKKACERMGKNKPLNQTDIALACSTLEVPCELYNEQGELYGKFGQGEPCDTVRLKHTKKDGQGHYEPLDSNIQVVPTGENNCAPDAILAQLSPDKRKELKLEDGNDLRALMQKRIHDHPETPNKAYEIYDKLSRIAPDELRSGGLTEWFNIDYWKALSEGDKEKISEIEALHQGIDIAIAKLAFISGVNIVVGMTPAGVLRSIATVSAVSASLDPELRQAIVSGNWQAAARHMVNHVPVVGSCNNIAEAYRKGNHKTACLFGVLAIVEGCGLISGLAKGLKGIKEGGASAVKTQNLTKQGTGAKTIGVSRTKPSVKMTAEVTDNIIGGTFKYKDGKITEFIANRKVVGNRLEFTDVAFYPKGAVGNELKNQFGSRAMRETLEAMKEHARSQGFNQIRIQFRRSANSSAANPGKIFDQIIELDP